MQSTDHEIPATNTASTLPASAGGTAGASTVRELQRELHQWQQRCRQLCGHLKRADVLFQEALSLAASRTPYRARRQNQTSRRAAELHGHVDRCEFYRNEHGVARLYVAGWVWSLRAPIVAIDLFLGTTRLGQLAMGRPRPDVRAHFDGPPDMVWCGFGESITLPDEFLPGAPCYLQACDADGRYVRFALEPADAECRSAAVVSGSVRPFSLAGWARTAGSRLAACGLWVLKQVARRKGRRRFESGATFTSFVLPVSDPADEALPGCIASLQKQFCSNWELLLLVPSRDETGLTDRLCRQVAGDARIRVSTCDDAERASAMNRLLRDARGTFVAFLSGTERLAPDALYWMAAAVESAPHAAWLYSDAVVVDLAGNPRRNDWKPDFSRLHLWAAFFTRGLSMYRRRDALRAGGIHPRTGYCEEYDLALRLADRLDGDQIRHVTEALVSVRCVDTESGTEHAGRRHAAEADAVRRALRRAGVQGTVREQAVCAGVRTLEFRPSSTPRVVIVIPTRDGADLLRRCLESLRRSTQYPDYHIVVVDNQSVDPDLFELLDENLGRKAFSVVHYDRPFKHSEIHNQVLADVDAEFAVLLNNDVVDFSPGWLEQLVAVAQLSTTIAGVGGLLLYPDGRVQHGGVIVDVDAVAAHAHVDLPVEDGGYSGRLHCLQELSACTAACLLLRLQAFREVGGFDAVQFPNSYNDVDLWLRLRDRGYRCVYQPLVRATHYESASRGSVPWNCEAARCLQERLRDRDYRDPFHHPQLTAIPQPFSGRMTPMQTERERLLRLIAREKRDGQAARRAA